MTTFGLNTLLIWISASLAFGCLVKVDGKKNVAVGLAIFMVTAALFGQGLGIVKAEWATYLDTMLYGGMVAFLLADRRRPPLGIPQMWSLRASLVVSAIVCSYVGFEWLAAP